MADEKKEKKDNKKDDKEVAEKKSGPDVIGPAVIVSVILLMALAARLKQREAAGGRPFTLSTAVDYIPDWVKDAGRELALSYVILANVVSLFCLIGLVYALIKMLEVEKRWHASLYPQASDLQTEPQKNTRWEQVMFHIASSNPSDWRLAILEADIILDELLDQLGYTGDTIGDKLKKVAKGDFETLDNAWEAHKIRNAIAHEGHDFQLSQLEAQRIIAMYQSVFQEFDYI